MAWGDIGIVAGVLLVFSLIAGCISVRLEQRKWDKNKRG